MRRLAVWLAVGSSLLLIAFAIGYLVSTGAGREFLRAEVERFLEDLLDGEVHVEEVQVILSRGIGLRGQGIRVYPSEHGPGMVADIATIELNEAALLLGNLELAAVVLEGLVIRANLRPDASWTFPPLQSLRDRTVETDEDNETAPILQALAGAETVGRYILEKERIAARLVVHNGSILFEDHSLTADTRPGMDLQRFQLQQIEANLKRPWLSDEANFSLSGTFVGPGGRASPVAWTGSIRDGEVKMVLKVEDLDLDVLDGYVQRLSRDADIDGSLRGSVSLETAEPGFEHVVMEASLTQLAPTLVLDGKPVHIALPVARFHARLEVEPGAARVLDAELSGPRVAFGLEGHIERPVGRQSKAHFEVEVRGVAIEDVGPIIAQLPEESLDRILTWFGQLESGTVDRLAVSGTTLLSTWETLASGELSRLPSNFLMSLEVSDVTVALNEDDQVVGGGFHASWAADRLEIRDANGRWRGEDLAELTITVDGTSHFIGMEEFAGNVNAEPIPGLPFLWELLFAQGEDQSHETVTSRFLVDIDYLDHPILRWPIENAHVVVEPTPQGSESQVTSAIWGGLPVVAEILYQFHPTARITVGLEARARPDENAQHDRSPRAPGIWGQARFRLEPTTDTRTRTDPGLLSRMSGEVALRGSSVDLSHVEVTLTSATAITTDLSVDLGQADRLGLHVKGHIEDSSCDDLGQIAGLPEGFITGTIDVTADIAGEIVRGHNLYQGLEGTITADAKDGEIRKSIPLAVALATATDGFNPFAKRETLRYETIRSQIRLADGKLTAEHLELEGPVRIYATGTLNFAEPPQEIDAVVGVFLLQRIRELLGKVPILNLVLPGSDKGFVGAYLRVQGPWEDPEVTTMAMKSLKEGLPDLITKPFDMIQSLWSSEGGSSDEKAGVPPESVVPQESVVR